jgi:uncharacterized iron-regulated membrane protein
MTWQDLLAIVGVVVGLLSLAGAIWGLVIALEQLRKTQTSAEAAIVGREDAVRRLTRTQLLVLTMQLQALQAEILDSIERGERIATVKGLTRWHQASGQMVGILTSADLGSRKMYEDLQRASILAAQAADAAMMKPDADLKIITEAYRSVVIATTLKLTALLGQVGGEAG